MLRSEAEAMDIFSSIQFYTEKDLPRICPGKYLNFIKKNPRGYGYWMWKPLVLLDVMTGPGKVSRPGDVVLYLDSGSSLNVRGRPRMLEYIDALVDNPDGILSPGQLGWKEKVWTKEDALRRLNCDKECRESRQIHGGSLMLCHSKKNINFIKKWFSLMVENNHHLLDDTPSIYPNCPQFREHRHDQSLLSLLLKTTRPDAVVYPDETESRKRKFPIWSTRRRA